MVRCEQKKARFIDKGLVDLAGHRSIDNKTKTDFCEVYKPYFTISAFIPVLILAALASSVSICISNVKVGSTRIKTLL